MKKSIFIAMHYLEIGGAEISLIGLLNAIDYTRFDVDLFIYSHQGELMEMIPAQVNLLPEIRKYAMLERPMKEVLKRGYWDLILGRLWAKKACNDFMRKNNLQDGSSVFQYVAHATTPLLPKINSNKEYDLAISFLTPHNIVRDKVKAKQKMAWIHTDYTNISVNAASEMPVWNAFDYIASISDDVTKSFLSVFPSLESKIVLIENILSPAFVRKRACEFNVDNEMKSDSESYTFLSIGRFTHAKNFDNVPAIAKKIIEKGLRFKWYLIGYGGDEQLIQENIRKEGMEESVVILGKRSNPYPYIKACDIYIQPSRYEGKSVSVREAQMMCKPVIVTNYPTASSQVRHLEDGYIVPLDNEACAESIFGFIQEGTMQINICQNLANIDFGNEQEISKIERIFL